MLSAGEVTARQQPQALQQVAAKLAEAEQAAAALLKELSGPGAALLSGLQLNFPTSLLQQLLLAVQGDDVKPAEQQQEKQKATGLADAAAEELRQRLLGLAKQVVELQVQLAHKDAQFQKLLQVSMSAARLAVLLTSQQPASTVVPFATASSRCVVDTVDTVST
jgi:hypothetical protein